ncbi:hypothetical protein LCGC14_1967760 [marine sediment metagenome]|uniref:Uncharacterized protein n=1 Tax=marine sediment metagenome TaxID=412755 RepID=A0A0F9FCM4_9ZZZZ
MKAEDTIMSWERIRMILQEQDKKGQHDNMFRLEAIAQAQAEISFKAGQADGRLLSDDTRLGHYRAGIKEVVKWIRKSGLLPSDYVAKLKEWGIDNE